MTIAPDQLRRPGQLSEIVQFFAAGAHPSLFFDLSSREKQRVSNA